MFWSLHRGFGHISNFWSQNDLTVAVALPYNAPPEWKHLAVITEASIPASLMTDLSIVEIRSDEVQR